MKDASSKAELMLDTFNIHERFSEITTYQKETFDLLWKMCKIIKPIVAAFIPAQEAFLFDSAFIMGRSEKSFLVVRQGTKETMLELTEAILENVRDSDKYKEIVEKLLGKYETIISNLVGYADLAPFMVNYNSKVSLFKYALSLAHEGNVLESSGSDNGKVNLKYSQAELVISLILRECYGMGKAKAYALENGTTEYEIVDNTGKRKGMNEGVDDEVEGILRIKSLSEYERWYICKIRSELCAKLVGAKL